MAAAGGASESTEACLRRNEAPVELREDTKATKTGLFAQQGLLAAVQGPTLFIFPSGSKALFLGSAFLGIT